jgi:hypothetical protein
MANRDTVNFVTQLLTPYSQQEQEQLDYHNSMMDMINVAASAANIGFVYLQENWWAIVCLLVALVVFKRKGSL